MKNRVLAGALCVLAGVLLGTPSATAAPRIGFLTKSKSAFWAAAEEGARHAGAEFGAEVIVKSPLNESDVAVQIQLVEALAAQGVDAIVIAPSSRDSLAAPLAAAAARGIRIVLFDTRLEGDPGYVFVGTDQRDAGRAAGALLSSLLEEGDPVAFLKHNQTSGATLQREQGAFEKLRELRAGFSVAASAFVGVEKGAEKARVAALLDQHPAVRALLASSTPATLAAVELIEERKLAGTVKCVGFGFNLTPAVADAIRRNALQGWIAQLPGKMGYGSVKAAVALCRGDPVPKTIPTEYLVVTAENLDQPQVQALLTP